MKDSFEKIVAEIRETCTSDGFDFVDVKPDEVLAWADRLESLARQHREEVEAAEAALWEALRKDAERYRHLFDCPEPFCYRGEVYDTKAVADAAIDAAMNGANT